MPAKLTVVNSTSPGKTAYMGLNKALRLQKAGRLKILAGNRVEMIDTPQQSAIRLQIVTTQLDTLRGYDRAAHRGLATQRQIKGIPIVGRDPWRSLITVR